MNEQEYRDCINKMLDAIHDPDKLRRVYIIVHGMFIKEEKRHETTEI